VLDRIAKNGGESAPVIARASAGGAGRRGGGDVVSRPPFHQLGVASGARRAAGTGRGGGPSIDLALQTALEADVRHTVKEMHQFGAEACPRLVVLANRTGEILAWVGSPDFFEPDNGQVDMVVSPPPAGVGVEAVFSTGAALDGSFTPASILADVATVYPTRDRPLRPPAITTGDIGGRSGCGKR